MNRSASHCESAQADGPAATPQHHTRSQSPAHDNHILFAGYWRDSQTGLYHARNRMYHVQLGLCLQRDPLGHVDGMSLYEYVGSRPRKRAPP